MIRRTLELPCTILPKGSRAGGPPDLSGAAI